MGKNRNNQKDNMNTEPSQDLEQSAEPADNVTGELNEGVVSEGAVTVPTPIIDAAALALRPVTESTLTPIPQPAAAFMGFSQVSEPTPVVVIAPLSMATPPFPHDTYALPLSCSASSRLVIQELKDYVEMMTRKIQLPAAAGGQAQAGLYHTLIQLINTPAVEFDAVFTLALTIIKDQLNGAFSDMNVHRYTPHVVLPVKSAAHLRYLVNALITLADPATREVGKRQTNVEQALGVSSIKEEARQRVLAFFHF